MYEKYKIESLKRIESCENDEELQRTWIPFHEQMLKVKYAYNFFWHGIPILQVPQDLQAMQEIIWEVKPDLIIESGVALGGTSIFFASMLTLLEACGEIEDGRVIGIEINLYPESREAIFNHPLSKKITIIDGSSTDKEVIERVKELAKGKRVIISLDSNHVHDHVLAELRAYSPLVEKGGYIIVNDTGVEDLPKGSCPDRPWGKGNNPKTAVWEFLKENDDFIIDKTIDSKLLFTAHLSGYLKRIK